MIDQNDATQTPVGRQLQVHLNGRLVPAGEAALRIDDVGFLHGAGAWVTLTARHGRPFRLDRHLDRLADTVGLLGLHVSDEAAAEGLTGALDALLVANGLDGPDASARIRITVTPGPLGGDEPTTLITATAAVPVPQEVYTRGLGVVVSSFKQAIGDPTYGYQTLCYLPRVLARQEAHRKGFAEALWYTPHNRLAEACFSNVFLVHEGILRTPPRDTPVVAGVTREAVLELGRELGIPVDDQGELLVQDMLGADEIFLTSSGLGVAPVVRVERHAVGAETPGPVTQRLIEAYEALVERETGR